MNSPATGGRGNWACTCQQCLPGPVPGCPGVWGHCTCWFCVQPASPSCGRPMLGGTTGRPCKSLLSAHGLPRCASAGSPVTQCLCRAAPDACALRQEEGQKQRRLRQEERTGRIRAEVSLTLCAAHQHRLSPSSASFTAACRLQKHVCCRSSRRHVPGSAHTVSRYIPLLILPRYCARFAQAHPRPGCWSGVKDVATARRRSCGRRAWRSRQRAGSRAPAPRRWPAAAERRTRWQH